MQVTSARNFQTADQSNRTIFVTCIGASLRQTYKFFERVSPVLATSLSETKLNKLLLICYLLNLESIYRLMKEA